MPKHIRISITKLHGEQSRKTRDIGGTSAAMSGGDAPVVAARPGSIYEESYYENAQEGQWREARNIGGIGATSATSAPMSAGEAAYVTMTFGRCRRCRRSRRSRRGIGSTTSAPMARGMPMSRGRITDIGATSSYEYESTLAMVHGRDSTGGARRAGGSAA
jgi:hypothetical protein